MLEIAFSDGMRFLYPCEYLRLFANPAREAGDAVGAGPRIGMKHMPQI